MTTKQTTNAAQSQVAGADANNTEFDFGRKYTKSGAIGQRLLKGFFSGLQSLINTIEPTTVHEVGCGEGHSTARIREMLGNDVSFTASDIETRLVHTASLNNPSIKVTQESIYDLPHADNSVDLVLVLEVLEHLDDPEKALANVARVSGNWVIASVPREPIWRILNMARGAYWTGLGNTPGHLNHWSTRKFLRLLSSYGTVAAYRTPLPWTMALLKVNR